MIRKPSPQLTPILSLIGVNLVQPVFEISGRLPPQRPEQVISVSSKEDIQAACHLRSERRCVVVLVFRSVRARAPALKIRAESVVRSMAMLVGILVGLWRME